MSVTTDLRDHGNDRITASDETLPISSPILSPGVAPRFELCAHHRSAEITPAVFWERKNRKHLCCSCSSSRLLAKPGCFPAEAWCDGPCDTLGHAWLHSRGLYLHLLASSVSLRQWMVPCSHGGAEIRADPNGSSVFGYANGWKNGEGFFFFFFCMWNLYIFLELYKQRSKIWL